MGRGEKVLKKLTVVYILLAPYNIQNTSTRISYCNLNKLNFFIISILGVIFSVLRTKINPTSINYCK